MHYDPEPPSQGAGALGSARARAAAAPAGCGPVQKSTGWALDNQVANTPTPNQALRAVELNQSILSEVHDVVSELGSRLTAVLRNPTPADKTTAQRLPAASPMVELLEQHAEGLLFVRDRLRDLLSRVDL